jgi:hypothetical protein
MEEDYEGGQGLTKGCGAKGGGGGGGGGGGRRRRRRRRRRRMNHKMMGITKETVRSM